MYHAYWSLKSLPFRATPDPDVFFAGDPYEECLRRLSGVPSAVRGVVRLTGDEGCGKTIFARAYLRSVRNSRHEGVLLGGPGLSPKRLFVESLLALGEEPENAAREGLCAQLQQRVLRNAQHGVGTVIVVDDAHELPGTTRQEIWRLVAERQGGRSLFTFLLIGLPESASADGPSCRSAGHLRPQTLPETVKYIRWQVRKAGAASCLFTPGAVARVHRITGGIPARVNEVCDRALRQAFLDRAAVADETHLSVGEGERRSCA